MISLVLMLYIRCSKITFGLNVHKKNVLYGDYNENGKEQKTYDERTTAQRQYEKQTKNH